MNRVAKRIKNRCNLGFDFWTMSPDVAHRENDEFCEGSWPADPHALCVRTQMSSASNTVAATTANDVAFSTNEFPWVKVVYIRSNCDDFTDKFVPQDQRDGDRRAGPFIHIHKCGGRCHRFRSEECEP